jgi:hypothetical protein
MEFDEFNQHVQKHINKIFDNNSVLFIVDIDKDILWNTYLNSFPSGTNEIYRKRREMDCSCCKSFIRSFGNVVSIENNRLVSIWDFDTDDERFSPVLHAMSELIHNASVCDVFVSNQSLFGTVISRELLDTGEVHVWHHFSTNLPKKFICHDLPNPTMAKYRDTKNVFKRSLEEISETSIETVLDIIAEKALYRGDEWKAVLDQFLSLHKQYSKLSDNEKENYCWSKSMEVGGVISKIKNHSIGVLLTDISDGMNVDEAVRRYESIVAPSNYKRPKAIFTAKMIEQAQKTIEELGLLNSLGRRHAVLSDITVNNVLWVNRDAVKYMNGAKDIFEVLKQDITVNPKQFENVPGISIEDFAKKILPNCSSVEILFENRHIPNLVSLISPKDQESPTLFKWDNSFSWAYNGNIADSMKQRVKAAGGKIDGVLRFSIQWNTERDNENDFDAHCKEPTGNEIYFPNKGKIHSSSGMLDVDIVYPSQQTKDGVAVENIVYSDFRKMPEGIYSFWVHTYSYRGGKSGFSAEIEFDGQTYSFEHFKDTRTGESVQIADIQYSKANGFKMVKSLPSTTSSRPAWNLTTNQFYPVSIYMYSPNYWDGQNGIGNRHYFFMLPGCKNEDQPNGFFNEYLREEFMPHKQVFEALGSKMKVEKSDVQLSGLGFSSTMRNWLICKVNNQIYKIIF